VVSHQPAAGYYLDLVKDVPPQEMWMRHRQRAAAIARKRGTRIPPQNDIRYVLAAFARRRELNAFREKLGNWGMIAFVAWILIVCLLVIGTPSDSTPFGGFLPFELSRPLVISLGFSAFFAALLGMAWPMRIAPRVARQLPWPRPRPLRELLRDEGLQDAAGPAVLRKEVQGNMGDATLMALTMNVTQLKQVLHKNSKLSRRLLAAGQRRRERFKENKEGLIRLNQRYERLLWAEVKMRGLLEPRKENWGQIVLKIAGATAFGLANGWLLSQVHFPFVDNSLWSFVTGFVFSIIGTFAFDELVGEILLATIYLGNFGGEFNLWAGLIGAAIMAGIWLIFLRPRKRRQEKAVIETMKERYGL
jgi:hypothetical protein